MWSLNMNPRIKARKRKVLKRKLNKLVDKLTKYLYAAWLGFALAIVGYDFLTWQYWFVFLPTVFFVVCFNNTYR